MRREDDPARGNANLLQQFAGVPVREDAVGRKIVGSGHKMRLHRGSLTSAAHAALGVGNNAVTEIDKSSGNQRLQRRQD